MDFFSNDSFRLQTEMDKETEGAKSQDGIVTKIVKNLFSVLTLVYLVTAVVNLVG